MSTLPSSLVTTKWLAEHLDDPNLILLDASWYMPGSARNPEQEWRNCHIRGARFFDFDTKIKDPDADLPHMLPSPELFAQEVSKLGISNQSMIVVYDSHGLFSAPRVWWMFKAMGHDNVAVLNGGLPAWLAEQYPTESGEADKPEASQYAASLLPQWVISADNLQLLLNDPDTVVLDARPAARFDGTEPEPRAGVRSGHMPNAKSLPFTYLIKDGFFLDRDQLESWFNTVAADPEKRLIFSCGSGVTACVLALAAELTGRKLLTVYDGSWAEWGASLKYPVCR
ncbi:3-mercaptopyruvate sulfurtransferase [Photobacterium sp.]|uniref:3-mercaptopyruvate sulfurtransferase n=1 Tax=Photobacterium sp. TaxID=660 RepID=UPI00299E3E5A|nr:3-mercaptopyruvate sulfurtransferase [Photobacterium sp.]MDX1302959.1 3-mercaptopyruvate sulfurtransferase [Photobacterium sp.]